MARRYLGGKDEITNKFYLLYSKAQKTLEKREVRKTHKDKALYI